MLEETADDQEVIARITALDMGRAELVCCTRLPSPDGSGRVGSSNPAATS